MNSKEDITKAIGECSSCNEKLYSPFYFKMKSQEVMVITAFPSMQAMYKPLYSIRFFRKLCLALFGDKYIGDNYVREFCDGNIYWTHYYKCLLPTETNYNNLKSNCAKKYLKSEIKILKPKLIIVFGSETELGEKIEKIAADAGFKISSNNYISRQFPDTGAEACYNRVREMIKPYISFMKYDNENDFITEKYSYRVDNNLIGNSVHIDFELDALKRTICKVDYKQNNIDDVWKERIVVPNTNGYMAVTSAYSFIESQVKVLLTNYILRTKKTTIFKKIRENSAAAAPTCKECIRHLSNNWISAFMDYVEYIDDTYADDAKKLVADINILREIRNCIVHTNGFVDSYKLNNRYDIDSSEYLKGIYVLINTILVTKEGMNTVLTLSTRAVDILKKVEQ